MMRKIINSILVVLITASMVWAVAPKYKIDPSSNMDNPPNIGVTTPGTGRFDTLKVTGASLSTSAGTGFYSLGTASFLGDITIASNATTRATGPFIISGAFNYTGATQGTAENIVIGTNAPNVGKFTDLTATTFIVPSATIANFITTTSSATNFISTTSSIQNLNIGTSLTAGGLPGTSGQLLKSGGAGSLPTWTSSPTFVTTTHDSAYVTNFNARTLYTEKGVATAGSLYGFIAGGQPSLVPAGASGLVLTATGATTLPTWQAASGGGGVTRASGNGTCTQATCNGLAISGFGFQPAVLYFWGAKNGAAPGVGFHSVTDATNKFTFYETNGAADTIDTTVSIYLNDASGNNIIGTVALNADGFTITCTNCAGALTMNYAYIALK